MCTVHTPHLTPPPLLQSDGGKKLADVEKSWQELKSKKGLIWGGEDGAGDPALLAGAEPEGGAGAGLPVLHQGGQPHGPGEPEVEGEGQRGDHRVLRGRGG